MRTSAAKARARIAGTAAALVMAVAGPCWSGALGDPPRAAVPGTGTAQSTTVAITAVGDRVSARVDGASLAETLHALASAVPVRVTIRGDVSGGRVWADVTLVEVEAAVRSLLRGASYVLVHADDPRTGHGTPRLVEVVVLGAVVDAGGTAAAGAPARARVHQEGRANARGADRHTPGRAEDTLDDVARRDPDAARRAAALRAIGRPGLSESGHATLTAALWDQDASVRLRAVELLRQLDAPVPLAPLAWIVRADPSVAVRRMAVTLLAATPGPEGRALAYELLVDPDLEIQRVARLLVESPQSLGDLTSAATDTARHQPQQTEAP